LAKEQCTERYERSVKLGREKPRGVLPGSHNHFFEDENVQAITLTSQCYREMINEFLAPKLPPNHNLWFQQNDSTAHTAMIRMAAPHHLFPQRMTSHLSDVPWPPHSLDLTTPDFYLWGYLKSKVYSRPPVDLNALQQTI